MKPTPHWFLLLGAMAMAQVANATPAGLRPAVEAGLRFMTERTLTWKADHGCASCHHAPMMLWSCSVARTRGYAVDEDAVKSIRDWMLAADNSAHCFPADFTPVRDAGAPLSAGFLLASLAAAPAEPVDPVLVGRMADYYASVQEDDGSWIMGSVQGRPPIFQGPGTTTRVMRLGLATFPEIAAPISARADAWLAANTATPTQQERVLDLLLAVKLKQPPARIAALATALLALQGVDGSWQQIPEMEGDAFATGQALYALTEAGQGDDVARSRAVGFLLETQQPDGSWHMLSRPGQGTKDPLREGTEPIVTAATGWALLGLLGVE